MIRSTLTGPEKMPIAALALATLLTVLIATPLQALPTDRDQPIHISSDTLELDDAKGILIYRGNVKINQGSINVKADKVTIYDGEDGITKMVAVGKPAHYQQRPELDEAITHAFGDTIDYYVSEERIEIRDNAKLTQEQNSFSGKRIDYDMKRRTVNAYSDQSNPNSGRVEMIIQPNKLEQASKRDPEKES